VARDYDAYEATDTIPEKGLVLFSAAKTRQPALHGRSSAFAAVETIGFDYRQRQPYRARLPDGGA